MRLDEFLLARIAEDEAVARAAHYEGQRWYSEEEAVNRWPEICDCDCPVKYAANRKIEAEHIANWDPARVLAECEAKRKLVEVFAKAAETEASTGLRKLGEATLRTLTLPYADQPDFDQSWSVQ